MRIFFLTQFYFDLHKPILDELKNQGNEVFVVQDLLFPHDPNWRNAPLYKKIINRFIWKIRNPLRKYWLKKINTEGAYNKSYDVFLCIDGTSFHPSLLCHLKKINPLLKSSLYVWDTNKFYDFFRYNNFFDKVYTFDLDDSIRPGVELLPSYWFPSQSEDTKYKLFVVGSDHDDRMEIVSKVFEQLDNAGVPSFLRIVIRKPKPSRNIFGNLRYRRMMAEWLRKKDLPYVITEMIPIQKVVKLIDQSECILDTDKPIQTGATQRVIWSLSRGKKIISTNYNLKRMPFYNSKQIKFIDRNNPVLDMDFINNSERFEVSKYIQELRIDKWITKLITFK